ncbi:alanine racemase [Methylacidimicrobium cyclopophantes]|uniref:Alanine racemase n=1 Tax=Methylacidimicrobium cyclopophantes TaxID=1041766 RepID=A0A5E6M8F5_9BACT|nr:alanine racemase [Methylacidimicrobium cyclopophantes]VVM04681.1 alanine racemase [Methylacidimicrobium cyclopophantes]
MKERPLRCWAEIDGSALRHNLAVVRSRVPQETKLIAVVKANAYGHGLVPVAKELVLGGADVLGVSNVEEAAELRAAGMTTTPILLLSACLPGEFRQAIECRAWPTISTYEEARRLNGVAEKAGTRVSAHFKIDTGMGRLGLWGADAVKELKRAERLPALNIGAVCTHFSSADEDPERTEEQWAELLRWRPHFADKALHVANSAALWRRTIYACSYVRVGLALYGLPPMPFLRRLLRPVMSWKTRITLLRHLPAGRTVSYGATYLLRKAQRLATLAVGYGDGYARALSNRAQVLVRSNRCRIRGRVTMDQTVVDVTSAGGCKVGDEVVLLGSQGDQIIHADELAKIAGTISYEIVTSVGVRVPRVYRDFHSLPEGVRTRTTRRRGSRQADASCSKEIPIATSRTLRSPHA